MRKKKARRPTMLRVWKSTMRVWRRRFNGMFMGANRTLPESPLSVTDLDECCDGK